VWFAEEKVDLVIVSGDTVEQPLPDSFDEILAALTAGSAPVAMVGGNHDWEPSGLIDRKARQHGVTPLHASPWTGRVAVVGVAAVPAGAGPGFAAAGSPAGDGPRVVVSHYPLLSEAERLGAAGLPYPGDLVGLAGLRQRLETGGVPIVVLSGHIHARAARASGPVLQLSSGALIEPPHDAAVVRIAPDLHRVERTARRLGPAARVDPVFSPDHERWSFAGQAWRSSGMDGDDGHRQGD
jgi:predicted phosphodiesterase